MSQPSALVPRHLLDPRPADAAADQPIADAVNIPLHELTGRTHELPPRDEVVPVTGPADLASHAVRWLHEHGRRGRVVTEFRYGTPAAAEIGRLWRPNALVEQVAAELPPGRALDLGCGAGREAVHLASRGWHVEAIDALPDALARGRDLARRCARAVNGSIAWVEADLERRPPSYDAEFDLIVGIRFLHRPLFERFGAWLRPGGSVVWETFTTIHRDRHGKPARDAHVLQAGELPRLLPTFDVRLHEVGDWRGVAHTARCWAQKPGA